MKNKIFLQLSIAFNLILISLLMFLVLTGKQISANILDNGFRVTAFPPSGTYDVSKNVSISSNLMGTKVYFTTNGQPATIKSSVWDTSSTYSIDRDTVINYLATNGSLVTTGRLDYKIKPKPYVKANVNTNANATTTQYMPITRSRIGVSTSTQTVATDPASSTVVTQPVTVTAVPTAQTISQPTTQTRPTISNNINQIAQPTANTSQTKPSTQIIQPVTTISNVSNNDLLTTLKMKASINNTADVTEIKKDTDGDGLSDADEKFYQTDLKSKDTDGDGMSDGAEIFNHRDPQVSGVGNFHAYALGLILDLLRPSR